jgi:hypothetical protein
MTGSGRSRCVRDLVSQSACDWLALLNRSNVPPESAWAAIRDFGDGHEIGCGEFTRLGPTWV